MSSVCAFCGQPNRTGVLYCAYCSQELPAVKDESTVPVNPFQQIHERPKVTVSAWTGPGLTLRIATDQGLKAIPLPHGQSIVVGRVDHDTTSPPDLDLAVYGALEEGVSRRHAVIDFLEDSARVTDLGSRNGTYINGKQLPPNRPHIISNGDELRLGKLVIYLYF